jgi:hypothetical protein
MCLSGVLRLIAASKDSTLRRLTFADNELLAVEDKDSLMALKPASLELCL